MRRPGNGELGLELLFVLCILMPLVLQFFLPTRGAIIGGLGFGVGLLLTFWVLSILFGTAQAEEPPDPRVVPEGELPSAIREVMEVRYAEELDGLRVFRGRLREPAAAAREKLSRSLGAHSTPWIGADEQFGATILLAPAPAAAHDATRAERPWLSALLLALTLVTTTWAGAAHQGIDLLSEPGRFAAGLPYALGLLAILGVHELGHYFAARRHGIQVTLPYFIPMPSALGTFGAFIEMRSPARDRGALFDVAVAGPLAGLAVAIPALLVGLHSSAVGVPANTAADAMHGGTAVGSSVLFALLAKASLGPGFQDGQLLQLGPLAFAGWLGLMVTALNLLPIGQLDGGHIALAMFGRRAAEVIGSVAMWTLLLLGLFVWPGLLTWALIIFFIAGRGAPPLDDLTPLTPARRALGFVAFAILALILTPLPQTLWGGSGVHCPYM